MSRTCFLMSVILCVVCVSHVKAQQSPFCDLSKLVCRGNTAFTTAAIQRGLVADSQVKASLQDGNSEEKLCELVLKQVKRGYLANGFRDVDIAITPHVDSGAMVATIQEGRCYHRGDVLVDGLTEKEAALVASQLCEDILQPTPLRKLNPHLIGWERGSVISFTEPLAPRYILVVQEALTKLGYPQSDFQIECPIRDLNPSPLIDLHIVVRDKGKAITVGDIRRRRPRRELARHPGHARRSHGA